MASEPETASEVAAQKAPGPTSYAVFDGDAGLELARKLPPSGGPLRWARLGTRTIVWATGRSPTSFAKKASQLQLPIDRAEVQTVRGNLQLVGQVGNSFEAAFPDVPVLVSLGRWLVVDLPGDLPGAHHDHVCWTVRPLPANEIVVEIEPRTRPVKRVAWVDALVAGVAESNLRASINHLAAFPTRHSTSAHFGDAARWARDQLTGWGYSVTLAPIDVGGVPSVNVVADRPGRAPGVRKLVLVTAHLDSINLAGGPSGSAPGADDNASGAAGVLEIGRLLGAHAAAHDLRLILFGGEEQGLFGSRQHVAALSAAERDRVAAVINMDMVACRNGTAAPAVLLEGGAGVSAALMDRLADAAGAYTSLTVQRSLNPFASDHVPFIQAGLPAVLTIEGADSANTSIHTANDTVARLDVALAREIVRMNLATAAVLLDRREVVVTGDQANASGPVVSWGPGRLDAFARGSDSALHHKWWDGATWAPPADSLESLGGVCVDGPELVSWGPKRLDAFVIGTDSALYHKWWDGAAWRPSTTGWQRLGGICTSTPKIVAPAPHRLDAFVIGADSALYHKRWDGTAWRPSTTGWQRLGGVCTSAPEAVTWGPDRVDVFVLGSDSALYHKWWDGREWRPSLTGYERLGGVILHPPRAVATRPDRLDVFVVGTDSAVYQKSWTGTAWAPSATGWTRLGGVATAAPDVVSTGPDRLDLFVRGTDHAVHHKWWDGTSWSPSLTAWQNIGGTLASPARVVTSGGGRLDVFGTGHDRRLYHKVRDHGGPWLPSPAGWNLLGR